KTLTDAEYVEYSREGVKKRVANLGDLYGIWASRSRREKFLEELRRESIIPELLAGILKTPDADAFDVIAHVAFGAPILTRDERAKAFLNKKKQLIDALGDKAREVILALLDKYRVGGVMQISRAEVFRLPPFDKMGYLRGVAEIFGGIDKLKEAINLLEQGLYESAEVGS
ncbi:MAG: type I restriction-modification enzyme R subunit C-terminal domain-containing protein, partial [Archaeoglobaceae archaeon]